MIKDSGNRREFSSGAVRDIQEGKGRCDLLPLDVIAKCMHDDTLYCIAKFQESHDPQDLCNAIDVFEYHRDHRARKMGVVNRRQRIANTLLEVSKHFEEGAKKYGEYNWQKGIPVHCYIDSAVRHYLKWVRGDKDEPHDRAVVWNLLCCIWTIQHKSEREEVDKNG